MRRAAPRDSGIQGAAVKQLANSEQSLIDELGTAFEKRFPMGVFRKIHGGPFMPGWPDLLVAMERHAALVEVKWADDADFAKPLAAAMTKKLTDKQASFLRDMGALDGPLRGRLLLGGEVESPELPRGKGTLAVGIDVCDVVQIGAAGVTLMDVAARQLAGRDGNWPTVHWSRYVDALLRGHGESWQHVGVVLTGKRYYGPIKATTDDDKTFEGA